MTDAPQEPSSSPRDPFKPSQFGILDLFTFMTLVAIVVAILTPLLRGMQPNKRWLLLGCYSLQIVLTFGIAYALVRKRKTLLQKAGTKLGQTLVAGEIEWRYWPQTRAFLCLVGLALVQVGFIWAYISTDNLWILWIYFFQTSFALPNMFIRFVWRLYPGSIEFFERGVSMNQYLVPWSQVKVRDSQFFDDQIVLVINQDTHMVEVDPELRQRVFTAAAHAGTASDVPS